MKHLRTYREEAITVLLLAVALVAYRWMSINWLADAKDAKTWPNQYDLRSEVESIFFTVMKMVVYCLAAWMGLRVVMPRAYWYLKSEVYQRFDAMEHKDKLSTSIRMFCILLLALALLALSGCTTTLAAQSHTTSGVREAVVASATADIGVREATGSNDGTRIEEYLAHVGQRKGASWCAAFVCYHLSKCHVANPRSAWSPALVGRLAGVVWTNRKAVRAPLPADVFGIWYANIGRVGHVGFVTGVDGRYITTVEGNTSDGGSRNGDGVYARRRELRKVHAISNYINDENPAPRGVRQHGARRMPQPATNGGNDHLGDHGTRDHQGGARHHADRASGQCQRNSGHAALRYAGATGHGSGAEQASERAALERAQPGQPGARTARGGDVRYGGAEGAAVGHVHAREQGNDHGDQGDRGEVSDPNLGMVAFGSRSGIGREGRVAAVAEALRARLSTNHV